MHRLTEIPSGSLWPFGSDKRMLYAIYAHFNTMIKKNKKVNMPLPILQKLNNICVEMKNLLQIITGMQLNTNKLDFELSAMFNGMDESIKYPQKRKKSFSESFQIVRKTTKHFSKKRRRKRKQSQCTLIYDPSSTELGSFIIDDYFKNPSHSNNAALKNKMDSISIGNTKKTHLVVNTRNGSRSEFLMPRKSTTNESEPHSFNSIVLEPTPSPKVHLDNDLHSYITDEHMISSFTPSVGGSLCNDCDEATMYQSLQFPKQKPPRSYTYDGTYRSIQIIHPSSTPPLPSKCRKSVAFEVMHRSKTQRRKRPLPNTINIV